MVTARLTGGDETKEANISVVDSLQTLQVPANTQIDLSEELCWLEGEPLHHLISFRPHRADLLVQPCTKHE